MAMVVAVKNRFATMVEWEIGSVGMQWPWLVVGGYLNWAPKIGSRGCHCVHDVAEVWRSEIAQVGTYIHI